MYRMPEKKKNKRKVERTVSNCSRSCFARMQITHPFAYFPSNWNTLAFLRLFDLLRFILYYFCESWILSCEFTRKRCVYNHGDTYLFRSTYTYTLHLFQLRLLQRRILHDAWSMFHGPRCIIVASQVNYVPATNLNLESKPCWRFYATSAER